MRPIYRWAILLGLLFLPKPFALAIDLHDLQGRIQKAIDRSLPASVAVSEGSGNRTGFFSGVIVSQDGYILSVGHAVRVDADYRVHLMDGRVFRAKGYGKNRQFDCAMIKIEEKGDWPFLEMGESKELVKDQPVIGLSHPGNFRKDRGLVVRLGKVVKPLTARQGMIQTTTLMEPGDSGGPLIDLDGRVVGIHSQIQQPLEDNYEVAVDTYRAFWDELIQPREFAIDRVPGLPSLGFEMRRGRRSGGRVQAVDENSPAAQAGLKEGDLITRVEGNGRGGTTEKILERFLQGDKKIDLFVSREQATLQMTLDLSTAELGLEADPSAPSPLSTTSKTAAPILLPDMSQAMASLESRLDNMVFHIDSQLESKTITIHGLAIGKEGKIISKNSCVGNGPMIQLHDGQRLPLQILGRDVENDLIMLRASVPLTGVPLKELEAPAPVPALGSFLLSPDPLEKGVVSVLGSRQFAVAREFQSRGYLGVQLEPDEGKVILGEVMSQGAAHEAGLMAGDQIVSLDALEVQSTEQVHTFLRNTIAGQSVKIRIMRAGSELVKTVFLGDAPGAQHVAELFDGGRSQRRDGFSAVFCHDAILLPHQCGGPVFDIEGNLMGLNVARVSRTHCYAIPVANLAAFCSKFP